MSRGPGLLTSPPAPYDYCQSYVHNTYIENLLKFIFSLCLFSLNALCLLGNVSQSSHNNLVRVINSGGKVVIKYELVVFTANVRNSRSFVP